MLYFIAHIILSFSTSFLLGSCIPQFVYFLSNQGLLGAYGLRYPIVRRKLFIYWADYEAEYVVMPLLKDLLLVGLFVFQHSIMAQDAWKRFLLRFRISVSERLIYVIASCCALIVLMDKWASTPDVFLWEIDTDDMPLLWLFFFLLHAFAWAILFFQIRLMDPFELIGMKQVYYYYRYRPPPGVTMPKGLRLFYQHMRHAGPFSMMLILWVHPVMTLDRLLLALFFSFYFSVAQRVTLTDYKFASSYFVRTTPSTTSTKYYSTYGY